MKSILLIDDSEIILETVKRGLNNNYTVYTSLSGTDALKLAKKVHIDLFIIDYYMPNMNGLETAINIRKIEKYKKSPIIFLTSEKSMEIRREGKLVGANGWIVKPCNLNKLNKAIQNIIFE